MNDEHLAETRGEPTTPVKPETPKTVHGWSPVDAGRLHFRVDSLNDPSAGRETRLTVPLHEANLVASLRSDGLHSPAFDIDSPVYVIPSSTPGHHHLYLERPITWRSYRRLLRALHRAGYVENAVYFRSLDRGATFLRLPWVKKTAEESARGTQVAAVDQRTADRVMRTIRWRVRCKLLYWWLTGN
jgi:hypothetical protein